MLGARGPGPEPAGARRGSSLFTRSRAGDVPHRRRFSDRNVRGRTARRISRRYGCRRTRTALRRRDAGVSARRERIGTSHDADGHRRRRPARSPDGVRGRTEAAHRGHAMEAGRDRHGLAPCLVSRRHGWRRARGRQTRNAHGVRALESAAHDEFADVRPRQLDLPRERRTGAHDALPGSLRRRGEQRPLRRSGERSAAAARRRREERAFPSRQPRARDAVVAEPVRPVVRRVGPSLSRDEQPSPDPRSDRRAVSEPQSVAHRAVRHRAGAGLSAAGRALSDYSES